MNLWLIFSLMLLSCYHKFEPYEQMFEKPDFTIMIQKKDYENIIFGGIGPHYQSSVLVISDHKPDIFVKGRDIARFFHWHKDEL